jgi:hypothetical protein
MDHSIPERDLARKFVAKWHLNVLERKSVPTGGLAGSLLVAESETIVDQAGWYPRDWRPDDGFDGGLIERLNHRRYKVYWKVEDGVSHFSLQRINEYENLGDATREYAERFFGQNFDGIAINWSK